MEHSKHDSAANHGKYTAPTKNLLDTALAAGNLTTWVAGIKAAGLVDTLSGKGPFTVFAPSDAAFGKLPAGALGALLKDTAKLKAILSYHVVPGFLEAQDLKSADLSTLQGSLLAASVSPAGVQVNGAQVTQADLVATNGVVHLIDAVVMPKHWQLLAAAA
jgi:uncharacterized surface protein with fasciclin (FAS1) repeats